MSKVVSFDNYCPAHTHTHRAGQLLYAATKEVDNNGRNIGENAFLATSKSKAAKWTLGGLDP